MARTATKTKPATREPRTYDLEIGNARAWSVSGPALLRLAAPKWSKDYQLANPNQPCTRLVKDVLRVGRWNVGKDDLGRTRFWDVTRETLHEIADSFAAATANGNEFNLCWGHGNPDKEVFSDPETKQRDSRDSIEPIDQVFVQGDTLWATAYVDLATANELRKKSRKVSVRVYDNWQDGAGNVYPMALLHVAVVDLPVMTGQGPFLDLAIDSSKTKGKPAMDYQTMLDLFTRAFAALGLNMPENVTEETLPIVVDALLSSVEGSTEDESADDPTPPADTASMPALNTSTGGAMPAELGIVLTGLTTQLKDLSLQVAEMKGSKAKDAYTSKLTDLATRGKINAKAVASLTATGAAHNYDLSLLSPFDDVQMVDMGRRGKQIATGKAPAVQGVGGDLTEEEIKGFSLYQRTGKWPEGYKGRKSI